MKLDGALLVDKPSGISSFDIIRELKKSLVEGNYFRSHKEIAIGHTGTLDPFATGLMIICMGEALSLVRYLLHSNKTYSATLVLNQKTESGDCTSPITIVKNAPIATLSAIQTQALALEISEYHQTPPMTSAIKIQGQRLYELARQGKTIERDSRPCNLDNFKIHAVNGVDVDFSVKVSAGTYIRTLGEDLAERLITVGHLKSLRRESIGDQFHLSNAPSLDECIRRFSNRIFSTADSNWISINDLLTFGRVEVPIETLKGLREGRQEVAQAIGRSVQNSPKEKDRLAVYTDGKLAGVLAPHLDAGSWTWKIERMMPYTRA